MPWIIILSTSLVILRREPKNLILSAQVMLCEEPPPFITAKTRSFVTLRMTNQLHLRRIKILLSLCFETT